MDRITSGLLEEFVTENQLRQLPEDSQFEHFCGYLATGKHFAEQFSTDDISVGSGGDGGIDTVSIIINGCLVTECEEVQDLVEQNGYLDVTFVFVQAERSAGFDGAKIGNFVFGVCDFLSESPQLPQNARLKQYANVTRAIIANSRAFKYGNPRCCLYYMTTGKWTGDVQLEARRQAAIHDLEQLNLFETVSFDPFGANDIQRLQRDQQNAIKREVVFANCVVAPEAKDVEQAFVGLLPAVEFFKLVSADDGELIPTLFYDNVRHWQEWNAVNSEMRDTLSSENTRQYFPLLNNGVTIVAKRIQVTGQKFLVEDFQIVNGCQTSYVLHECRSQITEPMSIPVRLIATKNEEVRNAIIRATNRQTPVTDDEFFSLTEFPRKLEDFFPSFDDPNKLYYERRSRQYNGTPGIEKVRIITMSMLVRAFAAMFRGLPHRTTRNYKQLLREIGKEIFGQEHRLEPYYVAALAHYRLEFLFRNWKLEAELKPARYHILYAARLLMSEEKPLAAMNSHEMKRAAESFIVILSDAEKARQLLLKAEAIIREAANGNFDRDTIRTEEFTNRVKLAVAVAAL